MLRIFAASWQYEAAEEKQCFRDHEWYACRVCRAEETAVRRANVADASSTSGFIQLHHDLCNVVFLDFTERRSFHHHLSSDENAKWPHENVQTVKTDFHGSLTISASGRKAIC